MHLHSPTQWRKREVCPISCFSVSTAFKHQVQELYAAWESQVFLVYAGQKHISRTLRALNEHVQKLTSLFSFKKELLQYTEWNIKSQLKLQKNLKNALSIFRSHQIFFDHHLQEKSRSTHNHRKSGYFALMKLINRYQRIRYLKSTSVFKEDTRSHLKFIIEETWCPRRRNKNEHFLLISVHADMATGKRSTIEQKMSNSSPF